MSLIAFFMFVPNFIWLVVALFWVIEAVRIYYRINDTFSNYIKIKTINNTFNKINFHEDEGELKENNYVFNFNFFNNNNLGFNEKNKLKGNKSKAKGKDRNKNKSMEADVVEIVVDQNNIGDPENNEGTENTPINI